MPNRIIKNIVSYSFGNICSKLLLFLFGIIAARTYGAAVYGQYNYAVSVVSYFVMLANMGIPSYAVYYISKKPKEANSFYNKVLTVEVLFAAISTILLVIFLRIVDTNFLMVAIVGSTIVISALNIDWVFKANQRFKHISFQVCIVGIIQCVLVATAYLTNYRSWIILPIAVSIAQLIGNVYLLFVGKREFKLKFQPSFVGSTDLIIKGLPFLFSGIFAGINCNIDIIFLGNMVEDSLVGRYSAAYKVINILTLLVSIVFTPVFPALVHKFSKNEYSEINNILSKVYKSILVILFPIVIGGIITGDSVVRLLFGQEYAGTTNVFRLLLIYTFVFSIREVYGYVLSASGQQKQYMMITCVSACCNTVMNILLIPILDIEGAAIATIASEIVNYILMKILATKVIKVRIANLELHKIIIATCIMGIVAWITNRLLFSIILIIILCSLIYLGLLYIFKINISIKKE